jgi:hypothetical protein
MYTAGFGQAARQHLGVLRSIMCAADSNARRRDNGRQTAVAAVAQPLAWAGDARFANVAIDRGGSTIARPAQLTRRF